MAALRSLPLCCAFLALLSQGAVADDNVALVQRVARVHAQEGAEAPELITPPKSATSRVRPLLREVADGTLKRATAKLKLPAIPAVFRWDLVGKITNFAMTSYEKPKTQASLELMDGLIDLGAEVLSSKDIETMQDSELFAKLGNITRLHGMAQRFAQQMGAPQAVQKLLATAAQAIQSKGTLDPEEAFLMLVDAANETAGPRMAALLDYERRVAVGKATFDAAKLTELHIPVLTELGAPPAVEEYLHTTAAMQRSGAAPDLLQEGARSNRMLAKASAQLNMPSAIADAFNYLAEVDETAAQTQIFSGNNTEEVTKVFEKMGQLQANLLEQLGGPEALVKLMRRLAAGAQSQVKPAEALGLLAEAGKQLSFPAAVPEFLEYVASIVEKGAAPEPERMQQLMQSLSEQVGAPEALAKFGQDTAALAKQGGKPDPAKLSKLTSQLFRKLHMPAFADIYSKLVAPMIVKGKQPDALALAGVAPSLMKVTPDMETAGGLVADMRAKLVKPLTSAYETAVQKLTGNMPDSTLKLAFKKALALARPA